MPLLTSTGGSVSIPDDVCRRAAAKWVEDESGCWISTYSTSSSGYAQIGWAQGPRKRTVGAHRAAWSHWFGAIPVGMTVDHTCHRKRCVRPGHMRLLSNLANAIDGATVRWAHR